MSKIKLQSNYAANHFRSDQLIKNFSIKNKKEYIIVRLSNGFGYPYFKNKECWKLLLNNFCYQAFKNKIIKIQSKKNMVKNFVDMNYVVGVIKYFIDCKRPRSGIYNLGSVQNLDLLKISRKVAKIGEKILSKKIKIKYNFDSLNKNSLFCYDTNKLLNLKINCKENINGEIEKIFTYLKSNGK